MFCYFFANHFSTYYEKRQMQLVLLIIMVGINTCLAETVTQLGPFYWKKNSDLLAGLASTF